MTLEIGQRVRLNGHWEFPDGTTGVVAEPMASIVALQPTRWSGHILTERRRNRLVTCYWIVFDQPADDGSGDGPYGGATVDEGSLVRID